MEKDDNNFLDDHGEEIVYGAAGLALLAIVSVVGWRALGHHTANGITGITRPEEDAEPSEEA